MPQELNCPNCGAPLDYTGGDDVTIRCPFCNTSVIVPQELRRPPSASAPTFDADQFNQLAGREPLTRQAEKFREIGRLVRENKKIEAIKLYREIFRVGLKEAKDAVDAMSEGQPVPLNQSFTPFGDIGQLAGQAQKIQEIMRLIQANQQIEAIKLYRETFGVGLKEAKDAVDAIAAGRSAQFTHVSMGTPSSVEFNATTFPRASTSSYTSVTSKPRASRTGATVGCLVAIIPLFAALLGIGVAIFSILPANMQSQLGDTIGQFTGGYAHVVLRFGSEGIGPGLFTDARGIGVDGKGNIYVGEYGGSRIQAFDASGNFITQWNAGGKKTYLAGMAVNRQGTVYTAVSGKISRYEGATGDALGEVEYSGDSDYFEDITIAADGKLIGVVGGEDLIRLDSKGQELLTIPAAISSISEDSELDTKVAVDGSGNIYALGTFNDAVFKFTPEGKFVNRFGGDGDERGQFRAPYAIAVDGQGRVYVSDFKGIQVFDADGRYRALIDVDKFVYGMAFNDQNELFVTTGTQVIKFELKQE
jgi:LSD1 subclass zinc finger protein